VTGSCLGTGCPKNLGVYLKSCRSDFKREKCVVMNISSTKSHAGKIWRFISFFFCEKAFYFVTLARRQHMIVHNLYDY
jgi:hypothetical protein